MTSAEDPAAALSGRLQSLRKRGWPGKRITQEQLASALAVSGPLISSWERAKDPEVPPEYRLEAYATFFATPRSVERKPFRLITQLTDEEQARKDELYAELIGLRDRALGGTPAASTLGDNLWKFPHNEDITIVCSKLPDEILERLPYTDPEDPDYVELYRYADLDALLELHGHIRAINPGNNVRVASTPLTPDEYTSHLVLLGGVDWNQVTAEVLHRLDLPVNQQTRPDVSDSGGFEVADGNGSTLFRPVMRTIDGRDVLEEDVAHFYRSPNPFNRKRTVTICNGMYQRGTLGAVRTLTDARFRDRNNDYVRQRFTGQDTFSIISRVQVVKGSVVTPDWTSSEFRLHEWPVTS